MKSQVRILIVAALLGAASAASARAETSYQTGATVSPASEPHQYKVEFKVTKTAKNGDAKVLGSPRLMVKAGEEGEIKIFDAKETNGLLCKALVTEYEDRTETMTVIVVKEGGKKTLDSAQVFVAKK